MDEESKKDNNDKNELNEDIVFDEDIDGDEERNPAALIKKLRQRIKELTEKNQEYLTGWQKERADAVNLKKRLEEEKREFAKYAKEDIASEIIPVLDSFDSAFKDKEAWERVDKNWRQGVECIHAQLINVLSTHGVFIVSPLGEQFDPQRDEAIETVPVEKAEDDGKIMEVASAGYKLQNKIIRAPKVRVGKLKL